MRMPTFKQTSKPTPSALCKAPTGIVVVKPQSKSTPLPEPLQTLLPTLPTQRPEHLRPLSAVRVPAGRVNYTKPTKAVAKKKPPGPAPRVLTPEDIAEQNFIADLILDKLKQLKKPVSKQTLVCRFNGYFTMGAIVRALHVAIKQGKVVKKEGNPSLYSLTPIEQAWTTKWTLPPSVQSGWTTQL